MIALAAGTLGGWIRADVKLIARVDDIPFAFDVIVCVCHNYTWVRTAETGGLRIVRWAD